MDQSVTAQSGLVVESNHKFLEAAFNDDLNLMKHAYANDADVNVSSSQASVTALIVACRYGQLEIVEWLCTCPGIDVTNQQLGDSNSVIHCTTVDGTVD